MPDENAAAAMEAYESVKSTASERVLGKVKVN